MTQEYKPDPPEQTEPEELVSRRPPSLGTGDPTPPRNSPVAAVPPSRQSPEPLPRPPSQNGSPEPPLPPTNSFGPPPALLGCRPSPPLNCDPLPGPSNLPPIQQVPLVSSTTLTYSRIASLFWSCARSSKLFLNKQVTFTFEDARHLCLKKHEEIMFYVGLKTWKNH